MSALLSGECPNCPNKLTYEADSVSVHCHFCDSEVRVSDILKSKSNSAANSSAGILNFPAFTGFDNPESGVVFLENFFDTYDWEAYQELPEIEIPEITEVIGNNKIKNGAIPETWYLDFMGLYVPTSKKFEGLCECEKVIIDQFDPVDTTDILAAFDKYRTIASILVEKQDTILKSLSASIKYAERFSLNAERLAEMRKNLSALTSKFSTITTKTVESKNGDKVVVVDKIEALAAYDIAKNKHSSKSVSEYAAKGIDAPGTYAKAVEAYNANRIAEALYLFEAIRNYSDSSLYIAKLNQYFRYFGEVYRFAGEYFIYKATAAGALDLGDAKKGNKNGMEEALMPSTISLYRVVDGVPAKLPSITGITKVITCYGTKLFFFKAGNGIACYDISTEKETIIDKGNVELYQDDKGDYVCGLSNRAPTFYVRKRFAEPIKGCFGKQKGVKVNELNPFSLLIVDMSTSACNVVVKEMTDIKLRGDDKIFYNYAYLVGGAKGCLGFGKKESECRSRLMVCDIGTGEISSVLDDDCEICEVKEDLVFYTLWKNNDLNEDLHVYNMKDGTDTLIEKNIYEFFTVSKDKIYYTIGNADFRPLIRANFDGSEREQIMLNAGRMACKERGGWFYISKGSGANSILVKIRTDGKDVRLLCTAFKEIVCFEDNYIYYNDVYNNLRVVRIDGEDDRFIAEDVNTIFPSEGGLYYCRRELVDGKRKSLSLYKMDKDGKNIRKIIFNIDKAKDDRMTNRIYFSRRENIRFKAFKPGKEKEATYTFFNITKYYYITKDTNAEPVLYLTLGLPQDEMKKGCFGKSKVDMVYIPDPIIHSYKNRGLTDMEIMEEDGTAKSLIANIKNSTNKASAGAGNKSGSAGCGIIATIIITGLIVGLASSLPYIL